MARFVEVDRLRGVAILMVVWHHLCGTFFLPLGFSHLYTQTWTGVDLFFVISGFVVTQSLLKHNWGTFIRRRAVRILPVAWLCILIPLLLSFVPSANHRFADFFSVIKEGTAVIAFIYNYYFYSTGLHYLGWYWSLAVEEHFYFLLPVLFFLFKKWKSRVYAILIFGLVVVSFRILIYSPASVQNYRAFHFLSHSRFDSLLFGVALFLLFDKLQQGFLQDRSSVLSIRALAFLCVGGLIFLPGILNIHQMMLYGYGLVAFTGSLLIFLAAQNKNYVFGVGWLNRVLYYFGIRSYSLYLIHRPTIEMAQELSDRFALPIFAQLMAFLLFTWALMEGIYIFLEVPLIRLSKLIGKEKAEV